MRATPRHDDAPRVACQAIPGASRRGWRTDLLCASTANTEVDFCGRRVPVCRIHAATYARWGSEAEARASELWGWHATPAADA